VRKDNAVRHVLHFLRTIKRLLVLSFYLEATRSSRFGKILVELLFRLKRTISGSARMEARQFGYCRELRPSYNNDRKIVEDICGRCPKIGVAGDASGVELQVFGQ
jgi:hypothetical protein